MVKSILCFLGLALMSGSQALGHDWDRERFSIVGGTNAVPTDPVTASTVFISTPVSYCSGTIIDIDLIVTAAHCVQDLAPYAKKDLVINVLFGTDARIPVAKRKGVGYKAAVDRVQFEPGIDKSDIAVIRFAGGLPNGYYPARLPARNFTLSRGQTVLLAGYGVPGFEPADMLGRLRQVMTTVANPNFGKSEVLIDQTQGRGACRGDSGGPGFIVDRGSLILWGVTSRGYPEVVTDRCDHESVYTDISKFLDFIERAKFELRQSEN